MTIAISEENLKKPDTEWDELLIFSPNWNIQDDEMVIQTQSKEETRLELPSSQVEKQEMTSSKTGELIQTIQEYLGSLQENLYFPDIQISVSLGGQIHTDWNHSFFKTGENKSLLFFLLDELVESILKDTVVPDEKIFYLLIEYLAFRKKLEKAESLIHLKKKFQIPEDIVFKWVLTGLIASTEIHIDRLSPSMKTVYKFKHNILSDEDCESAFFLYYSEKSVYLYSILFQRVINQNDWKKNPRAFVILNEGLNFFLNWSKEEKDIFLAEFSKTGKYWKLFFLMKSTMNKDEIRERFRTILKSNGRLTAIDEESVTFQWEDFKNKIQIYKKQGLLYTLPPFELLTLFQSSEGLSLREDITEAQNRLTGNYLLFRALAVMAFHDKDFIKYFYFNTKAGRLRYLPDALYIQGLALFESGLKEEANQIFKALREKYPQSEILGKIPGLMP